VPISREIERVTGRAVAPASVYLTLDRLQKVGLLVSELGDPTPERGGKAKRFFRVTPAGLRAIRATQRAFVGLWTGVPELKGGLA
jgi:PadR family transcriptional regulator PadR